MNTRLTQEDLPELREMHAAIVEAIEKTPDRLKASEKFGLLVVNAMFNIIATVAVHAGSDKQEILRGLEQVLDGKMEEKAKALN